MVTLRFESLRQVIYLFLTAYRDRQVGIARTVGFLGIVQHHRTVHQFQFRTIVEGHKERLKTRTGIMVLVARLRLEIPDEEVPCCFKVVDVHCNVIDSHIVSFLVFN